MSLNWAIILCQWPIKEVLFYESELAIMLCKQPSFIKELLLYESELGHNAWVGRTSTIRQDQVGLKL